jgi:hypothetical protein
MKTIAAVVLTIFSLSTAILTAASAHAGSAGNPEATRMQQTGAYGQ